MPQLSQEVNHFDKIYIVNLVMNQLIRKLLSSDFVALSGRQNHNLSKVLASLYCLLTPPFFDNVGVDGLMKKISKNGYLSLWRASFTYSR